MNVLLFRLRWKHCRISLLSSNGVLDSAVVRASEWQSLGQRLKSQQGKESGSRFFAPPARVANSIITSTRTMQHQWEDETAQIKSIFVYLMLKSTTTVTDAKVVYRKLLGGQCYTS